MRWGGNCSVIAFGTVALQLPNQILLAIFVELTQYGAAEHRKVPRNQRS